MRLPSEECHSNNRRLDLVGAVRSTTRDAKNKERARTAALFRRTSKPRRQRFKQLIWRGARWKQRHRLAKWKIFGFNSFYSLPVSFNMEQQENDTTLSGGDDENEYITPRRLFMMLNRISYATASTGVWQHLIFVHSERCIIYHAVAIKCGCACARNACHGNKMIKSIRLYRRITRMRGNF